MTPLPGTRIVVAAWVGTGAFVATAALAAGVPDADLVALGVALGLFAAGSAAFVGALVRAAGRSRTEEVDLAGLFFLQASAPRGARRLLLGAAAAEVVAALVTAGARPNTSLAFGVLVPVYGMGLAALWAARHGRFPARAAPVPRPGPRPGRPLP